MKKLICFFLTVIGVVCLGASAAKEGMDMDEWRQFASELARELSAGKSSSEIKETAFKNWGIFFTIKDGSWIAIAYRDDHMYPGASCSVAITSDNRWLTSDYHFCAIMASYIDRKKKLKLDDMKHEDAIVLVKDMRGPPGDVFRCFFEVENANTLSEAIDLLRVLRFENAQKPVEKMKADENHVQELIPTAITPAAGAPVSPATGAAD